MTKKITFFISNLSGGGSQGVCVTLFNALVERNYNVDLVVLNLDNAVRKEKVLAQDNIINLNVNNTRSSFSKIFKYLKESKPEVVLSFNREISVALLLLRIILFRKYRLISRNNTYLSEAQNYQSGFWHKYIINRVIKFLYGHSDKLIAQSYSMAADMVDYFNLKDGKVSVIYNPIDQNFSKCDNMSQPTNQLYSDYLLSVGRLENVKSFHIAIKVMAKISSDYPIKLIIIGEGSLENDLKSLVQKNDLDDRVEFLGYKKDLIPYYKNARLTLLTSLFEGLPNVLIESIACGTPVVAFDCPGGVSEIIEDGINGILVKDRNLDALIAGIEKALNYEWDKEAIKKSADKFDLERIISEYIKVLQ